MKFLAYLAIMAVALIIGRLLRSYINKRDIASLPDPMERIRLIKELRRRREEGQNYDQCYEYLREQGLRKGVAEGMMVDIESEQPPDLENTRTLNWKQWTCEYPGNWKEDPDEDLGPEMAMGLSALGGSGILFYSHPDIDFKELVENQTSLLDQPQTHEVSTWGSFRGQGVRIQGIQKTYKVAMETLVFEVASPIELMIVQITMLEEEPGAGQAFDLIESSFQSIKNEQLK